MPMDSTPVASVLSEKRKALFEPLDPATLLPPPDFDSAIYPKGWLIGKKRKLVNVDVVESMRRIAVQEMNRKDREIDGLNEQLEEDSRCLEHLQIQLLEEKRKRSEVERENNMLQEQLNMLMNVLQENEAMDEKLRILRQMIKSHSHSLSLFRCRLVYVTGKGKGKETNLDIFYL